MRISVVIPSLAGAREGEVALLLHEITMQTLPPCEVHLMEGICPSGRARNEGARRAAGDVLVFLDDDIQLGNNSLFEVMVGCVNAAPDIGMVGAAQLLPRDSSWFQRMAARQIPRSDSPVVAAPTDSDMVTTACCAIRRNLFWNLGGFNEDLPRGVDPEMRHRIRSRGLRTVVAPGVWFHHPMPPTLRDLVRVFFRNGRQSAEAVRLMPSAAFENPPGHVDAFTVRRSKAYRIWRHTIRIFSGLVLLRWIGVAAQAAYLLGYLWNEVESLRCRRGERCRS